MKIRVDNVGPELAKALGKLGHVRQFGSGEQIFAAQDAAEFLPIIRSGKVKMVHNLADGKEVIVGIFGKGDMFAVPPVFDGLEYPAGAFAMEPTELLILPRNSFLALLRESHELAFLVIGWTCEMLREKTATIQNLARSSPERRIAAVLLKLIEARVGDDPFLVNIRRQDIAEMTNLTTETVIRATRRLAEMNLVRIERGKILIDEADPIRQFLG